MQQKRELSEGIEALAIDADRFEAASQLGKTFLLDRINGTENDGLVPGLGQRTDQAGPKVGDVPQAVRGKDDRARTCFHSGAKQLKMRNFDVEGTAVLVNHPVASAHCAV